MECPDGLSSISPIVLETATVSAANKFIISTKPTESFTLCSCVTRLSILYAVFTCIFGCDLLRFLKLRLRILSCVSW